MLMQETHNRTIGRHWTMIVFGITIMIMIVEYIWQIQCCCQYWLILLVYFLRGKEQGFSCLEMFVVSTIVFVCCSFIWAKKGGVFWPNETRRYRASICISGGKETRGSVRGFPADVVFVFSPGVVFAFVSGERRCGKGLGLKLMLNCWLSLIWKS